MCPSEHSLPVPKGQAKAANGGLEANNSNATIHKDFEPFVRRVGVRCMYPSIAWSEHGTVAINDLLCMKNAGAQIAIYFS